MSEIKNSSKSEDEFIYISNEGLKIIKKLWDPKDPLKNFNWTTNFTLELPILLKKSGPGSETPFTLIEAFQNVVQKIPNNPALKVKRNKKWVTWSYAKYHEDVCNYAKGMISLGITPYAAVNIIGYNAPEWNIAFFGSIFGNYLPVGIYTTNNADSCKYITSHSDCELVIAENRIQLNKYLKIWSDLPKLKYIIVYDDSIPDNLPSNRKGYVLTFNQLLELGRKYIAKDIENSLEFRMKQQKPGNCCTLVYTSGTTGNPKGVMISHDNYTWTSNYTLKAFDCEFGKERIVSYLPLSHVASQNNDIVIPLLGGAIVYFADSTALQGTLIETLLEVRPTYFFSVPRIYEKIEEKLKSLASQNGPLKKAIGDWAKSVGTEGTLAELQNRTTSLSFSLAKRLVYNNVKKKLGLDQARYLTFGAAPMASQTREYFISLNMFTMNAYGMSECSGPETFTDINLIKKFDNETLSSCGSKIEGTELILFDVDKEGNGELCYKGRNRFMGYYKNEVETRNTIDEKGFLHSGDVGKIDKFGNVSITGRIKELIITAGGENVAPVLIENQVKEELPFISNAMVIGDKRKYLISILTLKLALDDDGKATEFLNDDALKIIKEIGSNAKTYADVEKDEILLKFIDNGIKKANEKSISRAQHIRKWTLIPGDFTVDGGELTPTLKLKRKFTYSKYSDVILKLYQDPKL